MAGTKELGEAVKFVCALASGVAEAAADGKVTLGDAAHLVPILYQLPSALDGLDLAVDEAKDLSAEELAELSQVVKDTLDFDNDELEEVCEEAVDCVLKLYALVQKIRG